MSRINAVGQPSPREDVVAPCRTPAARIVGFGAERSAGHMSTMLEINLALDMVVFFVAQSAKNELNTAISTYPHLSAGYKYTMVSCIFQVGVALN